MNYVKFCSTFNFFYSIFEDKWCRLWLNHYISLRLFSFLNTPCTKNDTNLNRFGNFFHECGWNMLCYFQNHRLCLFWFESKQLSCIISSTNHNLRVRVCHDLQADQSGSFDHWSGQEICFLECFICFGKLFLIFSTQFLSKSDTRNNR